MVGPPTTDLTLSNGNLTATRTGVAVGGNFQPAKALEFFSAPLDVYWEVTFSALNATSNNATVGIGDNSLVTNTEFVGTSTTSWNSVGLASTGLVWYNSSSTSGFSTFAAGQVVGVALHLATTGSYIAWRVGTGNWNNNAANTPATGSFALVAGVTAVPQGPAAATTNANATGDAFTATFAPPFANPPPGGFGTWDPVAASSGRRMMLIGVGQMIGWRAPLLGAAAWRVVKAVKRNGQITRRRLILPRYDE